MGTTETCHERSRVATFIKYFVPWWGTSFRKAPRLTFLWCLLEAWHWGAAFSSMIKTREESRLTQKRNSLDENYECEVYAVQSNKLKEGQHDAAPTMLLNWPRDQHKLCNCWFQCAIFICIATRQEKKMLLLFQGRTYVGLSEGIGCHSVFLFQWTNAVFGEVIVFYTSRSPPIFLARSTPALFRRHVLSVIVELSMLLCWSITTRWGNNVIVPLLTLPKSLIASMMYNHSATPGLLTINAFFSMWGNQGLRQLYVEDELLVPKVGMLRMKAWLVMAGIEATCRHAAVWWRWQICLYAGIGSDVSIARSPGSIRR